MTMRIQAVNALQCIEVMGGGIPLGTSNMDIKSKNKDKVVDTQTRRDKTNLHTVSMLLLSEAKSVFKTVATIVQKVALSRPGGV